MSTFRSNLDEKLPWTARAASDKARARRLLAKGAVRIAGRIHEAYVGKRGLVNYEAWSVEPVEDRS